MVILLDMDGVICDFVSGALRVHGSGLRHDDVKVWDLAGLLGLSVEDFWKPIRNLGADFWLGLMPYPWAVYLLDGLREIGDVTIVTDVSFDCSSCSAKMEWLYRILGIDARDVMMGKKKFLMAKRNVVLIDDYRVNVHRFRLAGGRAVLFPQNYNNDAALETYMKVIDAVRMYSVVDDFVLDVDF